MYVSVALLICSSVLQLLLYTHVRTYMLLGCRSKVGHFNVGLVHYNPLSLTPIQQCPEFHMMWGHMTFFITCNSCTMGFLYFLPLEDRYIRMYGIKGEKCKIPLATPCDAWRWSFETFYAHVESWREQIAMEHGWDFPFHSCEIPRIHGMESSTGGIPWNSGGMEVRFHGSMEWERLRGPWNWELLIAWTFVETFNTLHSPLLSCWSGCLLGPYERIIWWTVVRTISDSEISYVSGARHVQRRQKCAVA